MVATEITSSRKHTLSRGDGARKLRVAELWGEDVARRLDQFSTDLITPSVYVILLPLSETASLTLNDASTDAAVMNKVSSAKILPGHTLK